VGKNRRTARSLRSLASGEPSRSLRSLGGRFGATYTAYSDHAALIADFETWWISALDLPHRTYLL